jgi:hypothetical protein
MIYKPSYKMNDNINYKFTPDKKGETSPAKNILTGNVENLFTRALRVGECYCRTSVVKMRSRACS